MRFTTLALACKHCFAARSLQSVIGPLQQLFSDKRTAVQLCYSMTKGYRLCEGWNVPSPLS